MVDDTLRLYANPIKIILLFVASLAFVVVGWFMLQDPAVRANVTKLAAAYAAVGFFGLGAVVFLIALVRNSILRRPVLQIDAQGWTYRSPLGVRAKHVLWSDLNGVAVFQQQVRTTRTYYLALNGRYPDKLPRSPLRALQTNMYPAVSQAALLVPLNTAYVRTTPAKAEHLLRQIRARFASEFHRHGIVVADTIQAM
jgi:hypothetical protein